MAIMPPLKVKKVPELFFNKNSKENIKQEDNYVSAIMTDFHLAFIRIQQIYEGK